MCSAAGSASQQTARANAQTTWCKIEFSVSDPKHVNPMADGEAPKDLPPLTIMSLSIRTIVNHRENKTELLCATARTWEGCKSLHWLLGTITNGRQHRRPHAAR
jgi:DNA polymerase alpha subunit A